MSDYETLVDKDNVFFQKNRHVNNEYRIISSCPLLKSTNIINIVRNNQLFELIAKLSSDVISEYNINNDIITYVVSLDCMKEFGDKFMLKFKTKTNITSPNDCTINGASVRNSKEKNLRIFHLNSLEIIFNISDNKFNVVMLYTIDKKEFNNVEIKLVSGFLSKIVTNLNNYVCK
jgi:hypothetical protein